mgnify:CR=1 FL=1
MAGRVATSRTSVKGQREAYRRGFLIGVTLAEVGLLLAFVLLLTAAAAGEKEKSVSEALKKQTDLIKQRERGELIDIQPEELSRLRERSDRLGEVENAIGVEDLTRDNFDVLKRVVQWSRTNEAIPLIEAATKAAAEIEATRKRTAERLKSAGISDAEQISKEIVAATQQIEDMRARQTELMGRLQREGGGLVYPSCIPKEGGRTRFVYRMVLKDDGIYVESDLDGIDFAARNGISIPQFEPTSSSSPEAVIARTKPLSDWSRAQDCKFFVYVIDRTGSENKALYKQLLAAVEVNFYKLLARDER